MSLKKIAEMTGVSPSTVSRVLNGSYPSCASEEVKERIWAAAHAIDYHTNVYARQLRKGTSEERKPEDKPRRIGVISARAESLDADYFFRDLYRCLELEFMKNGILTNPIIMADEADRPGALSCDGIIVMGRCPDRILRLLQEKTKHLVGIWRNPLEYEIDEVICSGRKAAELAVEYLIRLGHRDIGYIGNCSYESRYVGYSEALIRENLPLDIHHIVPTNQTREEGAEAMRELLADGRVTAVLCANDMTALGALEVLGKRKKGDRRLSVISIDDIEEAQNTKPMLTTIRMPAADMAHMAVQVLTDRMNHGHTQPLRVEFPGRLIERESCYPFP